MIVGPGVALEVEEDEEEDHVLPRVMFVWVVNVQGLLRGLDWTLGSRALSRAVIVSHMLADHILRCRESDQRCCCCFCWCWMASDVREHASQVALCMSPFEGSGRLQRFWVYDDDGVAIQRCAPCGMFNERLVMSRQK